MLEFAQKDELSMTFVEYRVGIEQQNYQSFDMTHFVVLHRWTISAHLMCANLI